MRKFLIVGVYVASAALTGVAGSSAQTDDLMHVVKSGVCPADLQPYETVKYGVHCAGMDEKSCDLNAKAVSKTPSSVGIR